MIKFKTGVALCALLLPATSFAQGSAVQQQGTVVPNQPAVWVKNGLLTGGNSITNEQNVRAYGATGNGTTDDTAAFTAAISAAGANGLVIVPPGTYKIAEVSLNAAGLVLECQGRPKLVLPAGTSTAHVLITAASNLKIQNCTFDASANTGTNTASGVFNNSFISSVELIGNQFFSFSGVAINSVNGSKWKVKQNYFETAGTGAISLGSNTANLPGPEVTYNYIDMTGITVPGSTAIGINVQGQGTGPTYVGSRIQGNKVVMPSSATVLAGSTILGIQAQNAPDAALDVNFESGGNYNISLSQSPGSSLIGNVIPDTISFGLEIASSPNTTASGNSITCQPATASLPGSAGIIIDGTSPFVTVSGNPVKACSNGVADAGGNNVTITGNSIQGPFAALSGGPITGAIRLQGVTDFTISANPMDDASADVTNCIFLDNSTKGSISGNVCANFSLTGSQQINLFASTINPTNIALNGNIFINNWNGGGWNLGMTGGSSYSNITATNNTGYTFGEFDNSVGTFTFAGNAVGAFNALVTGKHSGAPTSVVAVASEHLNYAASTSFGMKCIYTAAGWVNLVGGSCSDTGGAVFVGQLQGPAGSSSLPEYSFTNAADAGLFLNGAAHGVQLKAGTLSATSNGGATQLVGGNGGSTSGNGGNGAILGGVPIEGNGGNATVTAAAGASLTSTARNGGNAVLTPAAGVNGGTDGSSFINDAAGNHRVTAFGTQISITGTESVSTLTASKPVYTDAASPPNLTSTAPAGYSAVLSGTSASLGGSALLAGQCSSNTTTVTSATTSMVALVDPVTDPGTGAYWDAFVSSANTVTVKVCATVALTPSASVYNIRVIQ